MRKDIKDYTLDDVWTVEGKHYDFMEFAPRHPGGETFLMVGKGRDCTELFKSVHQLSDVNFEKLFAKYEVELFKKDLPAASSAVKQFDFSTKSVFYHELRTAVKNHFQSKNLSHKATWSFWGIFSVYLLTMLYLVFKTVTERSLLVSVMAGVMVMFFGFCIMHTGSHGGLSSNGFVNWVLFATYCNCLGWFHHVWLQHHVYGHHSHTGLVGKDPDCTNVPVEISRKSAQVEFKPPHKFNKYIETFILCVFPSQFVAQGMDYVATLWKGHVFGLPINAILTPQDVATTVVQFSVWFLTFVVTPIYSTGLGHLFYTFAFYLTLGIFYWAFVETNHDTYEVHVNSLACGGFHSDWAAHQIIQSSNFSAPWLLTFLIGGMNYQIEHHLFPSVHPVHYPEISKIVRALCKKHNVPYVMHESWLKATMSHFKFLDHFSKPDAK